MFTRVLLLIWMKLLRQPKLIIMHAIDVIATTCLGRAPGYTRIADIPA